MEETHEEIEKKPRTKRPKLLIKGLAIGIVIGLVAALGIRMATAKNPYTHYHANFALYINSQQDKFDGPGYYEEVAACTSHDADDVKSHAHMHDNVNHTVHVHATGVTWSDFFTNLDYGLGDNFVSNGKAVYANDQDGKKLSFILNGQKTEVIANKVIKSEDVLLISYGDDNDDKLKQEYEAIPKDAHHYNITKDPAACSGGEQFDLKARFKDAIGISPHGH